MDCLHPIKIVNPSKYFSLDYADQYVMRVRCGKCANCQKSLSMEWYFRTYFEFTNCVKNGGFVLFDCLTYDDEHLPRVSRYFSESIPESLDFPCFDYNDTRKFLVRLRKELSKRYNIKDNLRYFLATEYGTSHNRTHRPHIHILFFVYPCGLDNYTLSRYISTFWSNGRTDGIPYKSRSYIDRNTIKDKSASSLHVSHYVAKYVNKSSYFMKIVDQRITDLMLYFYAPSRYEHLRTGDIKENLDESYSNWLRSDDAQKIRATLTRNMSQFHRQSLHYGLSAIKDMDVQQLLTDNVLTIPDSKYLFKKIALPMYYKRKLFYKLVEIDSRKYWQLNELGQSFKKFRLAEQKQMLVQRYSEVNLQFGQVISDVEALANYVLFQRGRIKGSILKDSSLIERLESDGVIYSYSTRSDKQYFRLRFVTDSYKGVKDSYLSSDTSDSITLNEFIEKYVYFDSDFEKQLDKIDELLSSSCTGQQKSSDLEQRLENVYKALLL